MNMKGKEIFNIDEVISQKLIITHFQPLVSINKKKVVGFEALSRGITLGGGENISPIRLINEAERFGLMADLDKLFRNIALKTFAPFHDRDKSLMLFIKVDNSLIEQVYGSKNLLKSVKKYNIHPGNVVIEIANSGISDVELLKNFVDKYQNQGFVIAIDNFGLDFSNWDRVIFLKPDIVKIDRLSISDIESNFFKQETAKSLINLSHNIGALVIAQGVETMSESVKLLELGADIFQGYYFGHPVEIDRYSRENLPEAMGSVHRGLLKYRSDSILKKKIALSHYEYVMDSIISEIKVGEKYLYQEVLERILHKYSDMECIYILNSEGIQISRTVDNRSLAKQGRTKIFYPDYLGADQSNKEYYYNLKNGAGIYLSEPYISLATGNKCVTVSKKFSDTMGIVNILCIDIFKDHNRLKP